MNFKNRDILSAKQFSREEIDYILNKAIELEQNKEKYAKCLDGKIIGTLFYEPSTRTRLSFESATMRLGGKYLGFTSKAVSSAKKGETLADTVKTISNYCDLLIIRHDRDGAAKLASKFSDVPIINAGSGSSEHPTQALLDVLTIRSLKGTIDGLSIGLIGDLKYGRTVHSLSYLLANYDVALYFISPKQLEMQYRVRDTLQRNQVPFKILTQFRKALPLLDIVYMTRIQKERFPDVEEFNKIKDEFILTYEDLEYLKPNAKILHPLPRVNEISPEIDSDPRAQYFQQTAYGLILRKGLLALILGEIE